MIKPTLTKILTAAGLLLALMLIIGNGCRKRETSLVMGGGPKGGTFQVLATGLSNLINDDLPGIRVKVVPSGGSVANLFALESGKISLGLVFAGDAYLGREGKLETSQAKVGNVGALARLYGAAAHLVVLRESSIRTIKDLHDRRIAIGSHGSGSALSARRYFQSLGLWDKIIPIHTSYDIGLTDLQQSTVDAVWVQVGHPNDSILKLSHKLPLRLINLHDDAVASKFYRSYPFYQAAVIPANTYSGQAGDIRTFQDAAILMANTGLDDNLVYGILALVFSTEGMNWMRSVSPVARELDPQKGPAGITIPLHPGAKRFWQEKSPK